MNNEGLSVGVDGSADMDGNESLRLSVYEKSDRLSLHQV